MNFGDLKISENICELLKSGGIVTPTPVQEKVIPAARTGKDLIVRSKTGTGKTLAFLLPTIERLKKIPVTQALIISPTRELAAQTGEVAKKICRTAEFESVLICGGGDIERQKEKLKKIPQLLIGTPGRLLDHIRRGTIKISNVNKIIIDEADELLKLGFIEDVEKIVRETAGDRQMILCSATMPERIIKLATEFMKSPQMISTDTKKITLDNINQVVVKTTPEKKFSKLVEILEKENPYLAMIFCATKEETSAIAFELAKKKFEVDELHGDLTQQQRNFVLKKFRKAKIQILVATDIAARGLDIEGVTHVISYNVPRDTETYIHRIGRTGRAGESGTAITLTTPQESDRLRKIEQGIKKQISVRREVTRKPRTVQINSAKKSSGKKSDAKKISPKKSGDKKFSSKKPSPGKGVKNFKMRSRNR